MKKTIERIIQRPVRPGMVGNGFRVFNYIPRGGISQQRISPFLMLDFNAEYDFGPTEELRGVDVHPHKGFETVTIAYKGAVEHYDSSGNSGVIHPGDVQWMTAGAGILHKEFHEREFSRKGGPFEMVQLWVNLPKKDKGVKGHYQAITNEQMAKVKIPNNGGIVNVIAGQFDEATGPAETYSPVNLFDIRMKKNGRLMASVSESHHTALLVVNGSVQVNGEEVLEHEFVLFENKGEEIILEASENNVILLLSGEPINEPIVSYGPFVMNSEGEIRDAIEEFQSGRFGTLA